MPDDLFGEPIKEERKTKTLKEATRSQSRAPGWQNENDPVVHSHALSVSVCETDLDGIPEHLHDIIKKSLSNLSQPVSLPEEIKNDDARAVMSVVYRIRIECRSQMYVAGDPKSPRDYVTSLAQICKLYHEEMLAERGFRSAAHGISEIKDAAGNVTGYRVQAWGDTKAQDGQIRTGHIHGGYCKTLEEAYKLRAEWWLKNRKIDLSKLVCFSPDSAIAAIAGMMRDAAINAGNERDGTIEVTPDVIYGDDEED